MDVWATADQVAGRMFAIIDGNHRHAALEQADREVPLVGCAVVPMDAVEHGIILAF